MAELSRPSGLVGRTDSLTAVPSTPPRGSVFTLVDRSFDPVEGLARFAYDLDGRPFTEELVLPALPDGSRPDTPDPDALDQLLDLCHLVIGTSYFKVSAPRRLVVRRPITPALRELAAHTYDDG